MRTVRCVFAKTPMPASMSFISRQDSLQGPNVTSAKHSGEQMQECQAEHGVSGIQQTAVHLLSMAHLGFLLAKYRLQPNMLAL